MAFGWLAEKVDLYGEVLPRDLLTEGFACDGVRVPLMGPQGIWKPAAMSLLPLSITTAPRGPYDDRTSPEGFLFYRYRGDNPQHRDNVGLREAMQCRVPLVYFFGMIPGRYMPVWPAFVVDDRPEALTFTVAVDDASVGIVSPKGEQVAEGRRIYLTTTVRYRLHQQAFRERVLQAYREQCSLCRLRHAELLDAAHIIPDREPEGEPVVSNGIALCKLHHAAFDRYFLGIRPDYRVEVRKDILEESDGPMLQHGLKALHGARIAVPREPLSRPSPELLERRYQRFREAS